MRITRSTPLVLLLPLMLLMLAGCEENTTGPTPGSSLETEINGVKYTLSPNILQSSYTVSLQSGTFRGTNNDGSPTRSLTVLFRTDLDAGSFPRTLTNGDVSFIYIETTNGVDVIYDASNDPGQSALTITQKPATTATGSMIVTGTFSGKLTRTDDSTKTINLTNGKFTADLTRQ